MKIFIYASLIGVLLFYVNSQEISNKSILADFLKGFCDGFSIKDTASDFSDCLNNKDDIWNEIVLNVELFIDLNYLLEHYAEIMAKLMFSLTRLLTDIRPCIRSGSLVMTILDLVTNINPSVLFSQIAKASLTKSSLLLGNIRKMYDALIHNEYYLLGKNLGEFLSAILITKYFSNTLII